MEKQSESAFAIRVAPLVAMFALGGFAFWFVDAEHSLTEKPSVDMLLLLAVMFLGFYVWVRTLSRFAPNTQMVWIVSSVVAIAGLFCTVQMDGLYGNGRPVFAWRWQPAKADQYESRVSDLNSDSHSSKSSITFELDSNHNWTQFRGLNRDGVVDQGMSNWNQLPRELWRIPVGAGWSSFIVVGDYCFTQEQRGKHEVTTCYQLKTGNEVWVYKDIERFSEITAGEGPRATPSFDDGRIYSLGATGILNCLDAASGEQIWTVNILVEHEAENCLFGTTASPMVVGDRVIVSPGGKGASLVAYDKLNGNLIWKSGDAQASYSSPMLAKLHDVEQVIIFNGEGVVSHELKTGTILWQQPWVSNIDEKNNVCQPILIEENRVFISAGYGRGAALFQIDRTDGSFSVQQVWANNKLKSKFASAVFDGENVFGLDEGILVCLDPNTGQRHWKSGRYGHGQLLLVGKHLLVQTEKGQVAQVAATSAGFQELAILPALDDRTWNHPVLAGSYLLVRNDQEAVCFEVKME